MLFFNKKVGKIGLVLVFLSLFFIPLVCSSNDYIMLSLPESLDYSYGTFSKGSSIDLIQTCTNEYTNGSCSGCNITAIRYPNGTSIALVDAEMDNPTVSLFNYTLSGDYTNSLGEYLIVGSCDEATINYYKGWSYKLSITESGITDEGLSEVQIYLIILLFAYGLIVLGFSLKSEIMIMLGSMLLSGEAIWLFTHGLGAFGAYSAQVTIFAFINLAVALFFLTKSSLEMLNLVN